MKKRTLTLLGLVAAGLPGCASHDRSYATSVELTDSSISQGGASFDPPVDVSARFDDVVHVYTGPDKAIAVDFDTGPLLAGVRDGDTFTAVTSTVRAYESNGCTIDHAFEFTLDGEFPDGALGGILEVSATQASDCAGYEVELSWEFTLTSTRLTAAGSHLPSGGGEADGATSSNPWPVQF